MTHGRPQQIGDLLAQLMARRGYARQTAAADFSAAWREAVGPTLAAFTRAGNLRRGALEVLVANSALLQEITFQKQAVLGRLQALLPDQKIRDLRFKIGTLS